MIFSLLKKLLFVALVLVLGQIPIGDSSIAAMFYRRVVGVFHWGGQEIAKHPLVGKLGATPSAWLKKAGVSLDLTPSAKEETDEPSKDGEGLSPSDKQALMRLLE